MSCSQKKKMEAPDLWFALFGTMSVEGFVGELGYPSGICMRRWILGDPRHDPDKPQYRSKPVLTKLQAPRPIAEGASLATAAAEAGIAPYAVERWRNKYAGGTAALSVLRRRTRRTACQRSAARGRYARLLGAGAQLEMGLRHNRV